MSDDKQYRDLIPVIVEREGAVMPDGFDSWGVKTTTADLRTRDGYQWGLPGSVMRANNVVPENDGACPLTYGDGLCVGLSWEGMASGGRPARTLLLVAYRKDEVLGRDVEAGKLRTRRVAVVKLVDGERLVREVGHGANLCQADLRGMNLSEADLRGANLGCARLQGADLSYADLSYADLRYADMRYANLRQTNLSYADLRYAILPEEGYRGVVRFE